MNSPDRTVHKRHGRRVPLLYVVLSVLLVFGVLVSAGTGQLAIPPQEVLGSILHRIGIDWLPLPSVNAGDQALWAIRFPRVAMAVLVGIGLAVSGLVMQAIFGNPLAEPGVIGISSGAAVGAGISIVFGLTVFGEWTTAVLAFLTGLAATLVVYVMSRADGRTEVVTLVLTGIAVNAIGGAAIAGLTFVGDTQSREAIVFWQLGSLKGMGWTQVMIVTPIIAIGLIAAYLSGRKLDLLALGERNARHLGVNVELLRIGMILVVSLLVGAAVAFAGIISFVGLVIPHLMRMIMGPAHLPLITASALAGALLMTLADLAARTIVPMAELPIGILTALVGGPFFFWLLRRTRKRSGGWG
ncbi:FecCD family ABC transporter permease [Leucobacter denitrificans]|uniref:Iron ABC transporter permease n=1 Tax=Leucobacter denitrificans TaxID=683042 RepID=A0A7G9S3Q5_9MICO|nr:iron ABC transporter permease [Leucobacter denitrificans]QNN62480.1 iron ABC transporter permease [Leucobacter denitrificans]